MIALQHAVRRSRWFVACNVVFLPTCTDHASSAYSCFYAVVSVCFAPSCTVVSLAGTSLSCSTSQLDQTSLTPEPAKITSQLGTESHSGSFDMPCEEVKG